MKKLFLSFFLLLPILIFTGHPAFCDASPARVAVLPFKINAMEDYSFLQDGIQDMLTSRLFWEGKVFVIDKDSTNAAVKSISDFTGKSHALLAGAKLNADYIIYGSLTILGDNASIDAKITDITGQNEPTTIFKQMDNAGQVIPEINLFATDINTRVFHRPLPKSFQPAQTAGSNQQAQYTPNKNFIAADSIGQAGNFWKSGKLPFPIVGMDYGDVNNDGINDIVLISNHAVYIYQKTNQSFTQIAKIAENKINAYIGVDVGDINKNGTAEIFVSSLVPEKNNAESFIIEYSGSEYKKLQDRAKWYYRIIKPVKSAPMLIAQQQEYKRGDIYSSPISIMASNGSAYSPMRMLIQKGQVNVLGIGYDDIYEPGQKSVICFNKQDYLSIFNTLTRPDWTSNEKSGGNMSRFTIKAISWVEDDVFQYFPMRLRTADTDQNGKIEVITAVNHDKAGTLISGFRAFKSSSLQSQEWDSLGLRQIWNTRKTNGRITDFFIDDFDGDGITELVVSVITKESALYPSASESHIIAYDLMNKN